MGFSVVPTIGSLSADENLRLSQSSVLRIRLCFGVLLLATGLDISVKVLLVVGFGSSRGNRQMGCGHLKCFVGILEVQPKIVPSSQAEGESVGIGAKLDRADLGGTAPRSARPLRMKKQG